MPVNMDVEYPAAMRKIAELEGKLERQDRTILDYRNQRIKNRKRIKELDAELARWKGGVDIGWAQE